MLLPSINGSQENCKSQKSNEPPGHLLPLGSHMFSKNDVATLNALPHPQDFFQNYVQVSRPVVLKGAAKHLPAFNLWSDEYLR